MKDLKALKEVIGARIQEARKKNNLTQITLSEKLNISRTSVSAWEMGLSMPSIQNLIDVAKLCHVSTDFILGLSNDESIDISNFDKSSKDIIYLMLDKFNPGNADFMYKGQKYEVKARKTKK